MSDHDELISQFSDVTGVHADRAKFYLESAAWQLEVALANFYEQGEPDVQMSPSAPEPAAPDPPQAPPSSAAKKAPKEKSRFATLHTMSKEDSDSDEEEGQAFYAGGSERSGQQVIGPGKKKHDIVAEMFKSAKEHAEVIDPRSKARKKDAHFSGVGYRLGQGSEDTEVVGGPSNAEESPREVTLKLWRNGFSLNNEPMRDYSDPANKDFLDSIRRGEIPMELQRRWRGPGTEVHLSMEDHRHQDYAETSSSRASVQPFTGQGMMLGRWWPLDLLFRPVLELAAFIWRLLLSPILALGSPSPPTVGGATEGGGAGGAAVPPPPVTEEAREAAEKEAQAALALDQDQPQTSIQIRLADGTRLVGRFNHGHTVGDLRRYVAAARPQYASVVFLLLTTFPNKELTDETQTLKEANLLNAAVLQRLK